MAFVANDVFKRTLFRIFLLALALSWNLPAAAQHPAREHRGHRPLPALAGRVVSADSSAVHSATVSGGAVPSSRIDDFRSLGAKDGGAVCLSSKARVRR